MKKSSVELLGKYDSLVDGRQDIDFQRDSCLNKDEDERIEGKEEERAWGKKKPSKLKKATNPINLG